MSRIVYILKTGRIKYGHGLNIQKKLSSLNLFHGTAFQNVLILTEHEPVYTIGIRTTGYSTEDEIRLTKLGAEFYKTNRGGLITFHGPGQLVVYPILNLKSFKPSMRWYIYQLETTVIKVCECFGIHADRTTDTGIWVGDNKICAIGVHGSRYITTHGLALNCNIDLSWFEHIIPCGIEGKGVTSISKELQREVSIEEAASVFLNNFQKVFNCKLIDSFPQKETVLNNIRS